MMGIILPPRIGLANLPKSGGAMATPGFYRPLFPTSKHNFQALLILSHKTIDVTVNKQ